VPCPTPAASRAGFHSRARQLCRSSRSPHALGKTSGEPILGGIAARILRLVRAVRAQSLLAKPHLHHFSQVDAVVALVTAPGETTSARSLNIRATLDDAPERLSMSFGAKFTGIRSTAASCSFAGESRAASRQAQFAGPQPTLDCSVTPPDAWLSHI
jgi:hypothetical protein